jgi:hypothetical protein
VLLEAWRTWRQFSQQTWTLPAAERAPLIKVRCAVRQACAPTFRHLV